MKRIGIAVYMLLFICFNATAQKKGIQHLTGKWEAMSLQNESAGLVVIDSAKIFLVYGEEKKPVVRYKADFTKSPAWFDFVVKDGDQEMEIKSLIQFVNDEMVQWQLFDGETRPLIFAADRGDMLYLKRKSREVNENAESLTVR